MQMTAEEICRHYTQASNKSKDIQVLADLNATDKPSIRAILIDGGVLPPDPPSLHGPHLPASPVAEGPQAARTAMSPSTSPSDGHTGRTICAGRMFSQTGRPRQAGTSPRA